MVAEIGSMFVKMTVDATQTKAALRDTKNGLKDVSTATKLTFGDMAVLGTVAGATAAAVNGFVKGAISGFEDLIVKSPVLVDLFSRMDIAAREASITIGSEMRPAIEKITELIESFAQSISDNPAFFGAASDFFLGFIEGLGNVKTLLGDIADLARIDEI